MSGQVKSEVRLISARRAARDDHGAWDLTRPRRMTVQLRRGSGGGGCWQARFGLHQQHQHLECFECSVHGARYRWRIKECWTRSAARHRDFLALICGSGNNGDTSCQGCSRTSASNTSIGNAAFNAASETSCPRTLPSNRNSRITAARSTLAASS